MRGVYEGDPLQRRSASRSPAPSSTASSSAASRESPARARCSSLICAPAPLEPSRRAAASSDTFAAKPAASPSSTSRPISANIDSTASDSSG